MAGQPCATHCPEVSGRIRALFAGAILLLAAQTFFIHRYGEPYPAIIMPGFEGSGGYRDGEVTLSRYEAVFVADGEEISFPPKVLLNQFPDSLHTTIGRTSIVPPEATIHHEPKGRSIEILHAIFPGFASRSPSRDSAGFRDSRKAWLKERARALVPGRDVSRVEIRWFLEKIRIVNGQPQATREPQYTLRVDFDGEAARP